MTTPAEYLAELRGLVGAPVPAPERRPVFFHPDGAPVTSRADAILAHVHRRVFDDGDNAPSMLPIWRAFERHQEIERFRDSVRVYQKRADIEGLRDELDAEMPSRERRRHAEHELADYIEATQPDLAGVVEGMRNCRMSGCVGLRLGGGHVVAWDSKCHDVRLCPDQAREETRRLAEKYAPAVQRWATAKPGRRVFYAVFTHGNYEPGRLRHGKAHLFRRWRRWLDATRPVTDGDRRRWHYGPKKRRCALFPGLAGALVTQEDPLSAAGDWNVHLNAILLVEGEFSFAAVREAWGCNVHLQQVTPDAGGLARAVSELCKYAAAHVGSKSAAKHADGASKAPPMTQWAGERWREWYDAQQKFRRTRSYGALYRVPAPESEPLDGVEWVGVIRFCDSGRYWVDLIPGDNFSRSAAAIPREGYTTPPPPPKTRPPPFH